MLRRVGRDHLIVGELLERIAAVHRWYLEALDDVDEETFTDRPGSNAPSIGFHLWHAARWADAWQARFGTFAPELERFAGRPQLWDGRGLAESWGLGASLGVEGTGSGLDDDASAALALPAKAEVAAYARDAFSLAEEVFGAIRDDELLIPTADFGDEGGWVVVHHFGWHITHAARHLGMIEALKGVHGLRGTATV